LTEVQVPESLTKNEYLKLPPQERERYVREILRQTVNMNRHGVTVPLLSKRLPFGSRTIEKHLSIMTYTNEIYTIKIGPTILYLPNSRAIHPAIEIDETLNVNGREYAVSVLRNRLGDFVFIQEKKRTGMAKEIGGGILIPLPNFNKFVEYLNNVATKITEAGFS
jgi:hypothetical protein